MINIQGFVSLKSGLVVGDHAITIIVEKPSGDRNEILSVAVNFRGKEQGQNIILRLGLGVEQDGLYWFDVAFDGDVLTRIPLAVMPMQKKHRSRRCCLKGNHNLWRVCLADVNNFNIKGLV